MLLLVFMTNPRITVPDHECGWRRLIQENRYEMLRTALLISEQDARGTDLQF